MLLEWEIRTFNKFELSIWSEGMAYTCQNQDENEFPQDYLIILPYSNNHPTRWSPPPPPNPPASPSRKGFSAHGSLAFLSLVWPDLMGGRHQGAAAQNLRGFA
jgi:hypothetical protein